ncbi:hypothetical protein [Haloferax sp. Atlit-19N]|uniref:Cap15 family cyclic dinucleotide receptor domain-containing protein n=1 Tax=Haloferax sp. Atlit-19N TaxID=2077201 RepID=UPI0011C036C0|nr:hypothetical protein [Haloferax sp. Atlit-19N]
MKRHTYSTDNDYRVKVIAGLGILAYISGTWLANFLIFLTTVIPVVAGLTQLSTQIISFLWSPFTQLGLRPEAWVPTTGVLFGIILTIFNKWGWRNSLVQKTPLVTTPDLAGEWIVRVRQTDATLATDGGEQSSTPDHVHTKVVGTAKIKQTWRRMLISMDFEDSISISLGASFVTDTHPMRLNYYYRNEPKPSAPDVAQVHYGSTNLRYNTEENILEGEYFTDRFRQTSGEILLEKKV